MATISKNFTAVGNGVQILVRNREQFTYSVSGTFVATVVLEKTKNGGLSWEPITSATGSASGTVVIENTAGEFSIVRFRCSAFTSGTVVTSLSDVSEVSQTFLDQAGNPAMQIVEGGVSFPGTVSLASSATFTGDVAVTDANFSIKDDLDATKIAKLQCAGITTGTTRTYELPNADTTLVGTDATQDLTNKTLSNCTIVDDLVRNGCYYTIPLSGLAKVGGTAGWVVAPTDNTCMVTCPAGQTGAKLIVPLLQIRPEKSFVVSFNLLGQIESAGNAVTLNANLRKMTSAAADVVDASIDSIDQISVTADTELNVSTSSKLLASPTQVTFYDIFYLVITATTAAATDIALTAVQVQVNEI